MGEGGYLNVERGGGIEKAGPGRNWGCLSNRRGQYSLRSMILSNLTFQQAS